MNALYTALALLATVTSSAGRRVRRGARDAGASALELAIIAALLVVGASIVGTVVYNIVDTKSAKLETCANQPIGSAECAP